MAADKIIRVRAYNVGFGDCLLVKIPDGAALRWLLIDFGNAPGQQNDRFDEIAENIEKETGGHLDVVVMTHEHLDHIEGFFSMKKVFNRMTIGQVWMSLPSDPTYYKKYPKAQKQKKLRDAARAFATSLHSTRSVAPSFLAMLRNNLANADRIDYIRKLPKSKAKVRYLSRGGSIGSAPASAQVKFRILAPEKDMSVYYGGSKGTHFSALTHALDAARGESGWWEFPGVKRVPTPTNLSSTDWEQLLQTIQSGAVDAVRTLDKAANNTSLVFQLEAHGKRLLFTGDAELESWAVMTEKAKKDLKAVDFLKVSHHGSHNGTPLDLLDTLLPKNRKNRANVLVSTKAKVYGTVNPVPDEALLKALKARCKKLYSTEGTSKLYVDVNV